MTETKYRFVRSAYGSYPWYAVPVDGDSSVANAVWIGGGPQSIETAFGTISCDGLRRFFKRKRDVVAAIAQMEALQALSLVGVGIDQ